VLFIVALLGTCGAGDTACRIVSCLVYTGLYYVAAAAAAVGRRCSTLVFNDVQLTVSLPQFLCVSAYSRTTLYIRIQCGNNRLFSARQICYEQVLFLAASVSLSVCPRKISKTTGQKSMCMSHGERCKYLEVGDI